jgi:hypothetical protein
MSHNEEDRAACIALKETKYKPDVHVIFGTAAKVALTINYV